MLLLEIIKKAIYLFLKKLINITIILEVIYIITELESNKI